MATKETGNAQAEKVTEPVFSKKDLIIVPFPTPDEPEITMSFFILFLSSIYN